MGSGATIEARALEWRVWDGLTAYDRTLSAMTERVAAIRRDAMPEAVWLVEHPPVYTSGTSARSDDLRDAGRFPTFAAGRGGQWTYHGPGQRTAYVMLDLAQPHGRVRARDIRCFVWGLEEWLIGALGRLGIAGQRRDGRIGIWVPNAVSGRDEKVGAIGVRIKRWVSWHGISLNVDPDLEHFSGIVPCGVATHGVTSLRALGSRATMAEADAALADAWRAVFAQDGAAKRRAAA